MNKINCNNFRYLICLLLVLASLSPAFSQRKPSSKKAASNKAGNELNDLMLKGEQGLVNGKYEQAIEAFSKIIEKEPSMATAYNNRGLAYLYSIILNSALSDFSAAISLDTNMADAYNNRGLTLIYLNQPEAAMKDLNKAISIDPNFAEAYLNRGSAYTEQMLYSMAMEDLNKAIRLFGEEKNPNSFYERGRVFYKIKKLDSAITDFSEAINLKMVNAKVYTARGNAYFKLGKFDEAVKDYNRVLQLDSTEIEARNNRAVALEKLGKTDLAEKDRKLLLDRKEKYFKQFPPVDSLKFRDFTNISGDFTLNLPDSWSLREKTNQYNNDILITKDKLENDSAFYPVGVRMAVYKDMSTQYKVKTPDEILDFWKGSNAKNGDDYKVYDIISQKMMTKNGYSGVLNKVRIKFNNDSFPLEVYELAWAKENYLFFAYFQAPEVQFEYYQKIFDRAISSLVLK